MTFFKITGTEQVLHSQSAFTLGGIKYPSGWLVGMTAEAIIALGLEPYTPPTPEPVLPTLPEVKAARLDQLGADYQAAIQQPVTYMGTTFQADDASQRILSRTLSPGTLPPNFAWLDAGNEWRPMTYAQLQGLAGVMSAQTFTAFVRLQERKAAVRAATTASAVGAVVW